MLSLNDIQEEFREFLQNYIINSLNIILLYQIYV